MDRAIENARGLTLCRSADAQVCATGADLATVAEGGGVVSAVHQQWHRADATRVFAAPAIAIAIADLLVGLVLAVGASFFLSLTLACGADHGPSFETLATSGKVPRIYHILL